MITKEFNLNYANIMVYSNSKLNNMMLVDGGYITFGVGGIPKYHFYQNDHLSNVRVVSDANGTVEEVNHYYPYGALMGESQNTTTQPYKYNGKELDRSFGLDWYDYGARLMDGVGGRWSSIDPLCEKYYDVSPYAYCAGESFVKQRQRIIKSRGKNGKYTNAGRPQFYPWDASIDSPMQFIGTYRYDGYSSKDGRYINNVVTDSKSVTSLVYHIPFLKNHRRNRNREFGTTYQLYFWRSKK